jgi:tetratricopeptide (TPR) repeat protein
MSLITLSKIQHLVELGRYREARAEVAQYLATDPDSAIGLCLLATCELNLDKHHAALYAADRALTTIPEEDWPLRLRALALHKLGESAAAVEAAEAAVRADPSFWANHHTLANVSVTVDKHTAHAAAAAAVELAPHQPEAYVTLGLTLSHLKRRREERAAYAEALRLDPENAYALNNLAAADINRARLSRGTRNLVAGLRLAPSEQILQRNLDAMVMRLMARLLNVLLLCGLIGLIVANQLTDGAYWGRASAGGLLIAADAAIAWWTLRHLPKGAWRHLRGLPGRMTGAQRWTGLLLVIFTIALIAAAFLPGQAGLIGAGTMGIVVRIFQVLLVIWVIRWAIQKIRRRS